MRYMLVSAVGFVVHQLTVAIVYWGLNAAIGNMLPFLFCLLLTLLALPSGLYLVAAQTKLRYRADPESAWQTTWKTVPSSLLIFTLVCLPFALVTTVRGLFVLIPLSIAVLIAGCVHVAYIEVARDQCPPDGMHRSDRF